MEDPPQVLFSLKIGPSVNCPPGFCNATFLMNRSVLNLKIENLYSPQSVIENSIGFQTLPAGYIANGSDTVSFFPPIPYTLKGTMNIEMTNVFIKTPIGLILPLTGSFDAAGRHSSHERFRREREIRLVSAGPLRELSLAELRSAVFRCQD